MTDDAARLAAVLTEQYDSGRVTLTAARHGLNTVFLVQREHGPAWVVRAGRNLPRFAQTILFLEKRVYPAPRLVRTADGSDLATDGDRAVLVMTLIEGAAPPLTAKAMERVGEALGRLHTISPLPPGAKPCGMLPRGEIAAGRSWLEAVRDVVPRAHRAHFDALWSACETLDSCEDLPKVFLHGDAHYNNTILTPSGEVVYVDYDSAGPGSAVIDLGFLLVNADGGPIVAPPKPSDPARVEATICGYCRHRTPSDAELSHLADAIRFRPLVLACADFKRALKHGRAPERWPLERVRAADELAERAIAAIRTQPPR
jgi:Ser/Thr protein kinase RdoA (MazF antagonist)